MKNNTTRALGEWAPYIALMVTVVITVAGAAWSLSRTLGRLETKVEHNALAIERNAQATAQAIERNAQAIERNAQAIERNARANAQAIAKVQEELAKLTGQYVEHVRFHEEALASR